MSNLDSGTSEAKVAEEMTRSGMLVHSDLLVSEVKRLAPKQLLTILGSLKGDTLYGEWSSSDTDLFWRCQNPSLMQLPCPAQRAIRGSHIALRQPLLYELARAAEVSDWVEAYQSGQDLLEIASGSLGVSRDEAKVAIYRYLYGSVTDPSTKAVEAAFPWLAKTVGMFEEKALGEDLLKTRFGTVLPNTLFPRSTIGRLLTQTVKDAVRNGVLLAWETTGKVPGFITPDSVVFTDNHPEVEILWEDYGFSVNVDYIW